jgi:hypothetical protein
MNIIRIEYPSPLEEVYPPNDNLDVFVHLDDGSVYSFVVATPNNIFWCMENENLDYFFGLPPVFVKDLTPDNIERALRALVNEDNGKWLEVYGSRQKS